jgi:hypothetical protein
MFHIECMELFADQTGLKHGLRLLLSIIINQSRGKRRLFLNFGVVSQPEAGSHLLPPVYRKKMLYQTPHTRWSRTPSLLVHGAGYPAFQS